MRFVFTLALRYLVARLRQSLLTIGGIILGVVALTLTQSMMGGFLGTFISNTLGSAPHISVSRRPRVPKDPAAPTRSAFRGLQDPFLVDVSRPPLPDEEEEIRNPDVLQATIRQVPGVVATVPVVAGQVLFGFSGVWEPVTLNGVIPSQQARVLDFASKLRQATPEDLERDVNGVILGQYLAERMRVSVGDRVVALSKDNTPVSLRVLGLYNSKVYDTDNTSVWVNLRRAQALLALGSSVNQIQVRTQDYNTADRVAQRIEYAIGMRAESWMETNQNNLGLLRMITTIQYLLASFTMLVAGFGIAGNLITTVSEKTFDIGVLKAVGMKSSQLTLVFIVLAMLMMLIGVVLGTGIAYSLVELISRIPSAAKPQPGVIAASDTMPMVQSPGYYLLSAVFALLVSFFAGLSPAMRAARLEPLNIIRNSAG